MTELYPDKELKEILKVPTYCKCTKCKSHQKMKRACRKKSAFGTKYIHGLCSKCDNEMKLYLSPKFPFPDEEAKTK